MYIGPEQDVKKAPMSCASALLCAHLLRSMCADGPNLMVEPPVTVGLVLCPWFDQEYGGKLRKTS